MFGQFGHFTKYAPEKVPYAINRYTAGAAMTACECLLQLDLDWRLSGVSTCNASLRVGYHCCIAAQTRSTAAKTCAY
jgi:hypothetical protein